MGANSIFFIVTLMASGVTSAQATTEIAKFARVAKGIYRGAQPEDESDYARLARIGIKTIINLRSEKNAVERESELAHRHGIRVLHTPMSGFFAPSDRDIDKVLHEFSDPALQPVFVHCQLGKDRTGLVIGLYRVFFEGMRKRDAYREMRRFGFNPLLIGLERYYWQRTSDQAFDNEQLADLR